MEGDQGFLYTVMVPRGYGVAVYLVGHGEVFEQACRKALDPGDRRRHLTQFSEILQHLSPFGNAQIECAEAKRFGGFSSKELALEALKKAGIKQVVQATKTAKE